MILDMRLPDTDGLSVLRRVRQLDPLVQVIVFTAFGDVQSAVDAMKLGACDFLRKPYEMEDIVLAVEGAARTFRQVNELDLYRRQAFRQYSDNEIVGSSGPMREVRELIDKVVRSQATSVLITGQSGTGKELVARAIHYRSDLYFRLKVVSIHLPPLHERGDDVLVLARHFLREFARKFQKRFLDLAPEASERLLGYSWPGNVRELRNLIERVVLLEEGEILMAEHHPSE